MDKSFSDKDYAGWRERSARPPKRKYPLDRAVARVSSWEPFGALSVNSLRPYRSTYRFHTAFDAGHRALRSCAMGRFGLPFLIDIGIDGFLLKADALKLHEMTRRSSGNILELGTHKGLSTSIMAKALNARGSGQLETVDIDADANAVARTNVAAREGAERVTFTLKDATLRLDELIAEGHRFGFVFVDHWHGYQATHEAASRMASVLEPGGFVFFHDYLGAGNADPGHVYGVYQAVLDTICEDERFAFYGNFGCCGLYRYLP
ncbi:class I SAM-dependent methyltransferase [Bosea sp. Tri-44]|uniref:O-methyltransferase n=1 Tax=Bosea sp. Tri-44 TaxID=1972137 RepID=UPI0013E90048|nr:class I SAM-dependent methyltransferase [Bosea sp. Tri-44]